MTDKKNDSVVVKWGIVGSGHISHAFCLSLLRLNSPRHQLTAVASRSSASKADEFAKRFQILRSYGSYEELFADSEINAVYIGNLTPDHAEASLSAIEAGKAVLIEKPMAMTVEDCQRIIDASQRKGVLAFEALWSRFTPPFGRIRQLLRDGHKPMSMVSNFTVPFQHVDRLTQLKLGGGVLRDIGLYAVQLATMLFDGAPVSIQATGQGNEQGVDIADSVALKFANGGCASILVDSRCGHRNLTEARIFFAPGSEFCSVRLCPPFYVTTKLELTKADSGEVIVENYPIYPDLPPPPEGLSFRNAASQALAYEAEAFADIFQQWWPARGTPGAIVDHPLRTHEQTLVDARIIAAATGQWINKNN